MKIRLSKRGKLTIGILVFLIIIMSLTGMGFFKSKLEVEYYSVKKGIVKNIVSSEGKVKSNNLSTKFALIDGEIEEMNYKVGDFVKKGDVIATINTDDIESKIDGVNAQIDNLDYALKEVLKPADKEKIRVLEYSINSAKVSLERDKSTLKKKEKLFEEEAISLEELNKIQDKVKISENNLLSLKNDLSLLKKSASINVKLQYNSQIKVLESSKQELENSLKKAQIVAEEEGLITEKYVEDGEFILRGSPIVEIANLKNVKILADVLESEVNDIKLDMLVLVEDIISDNIVKGKVSKIYPKVYSELTELGIKQKKVNVEILIPNLSNGYLLNQELDLDFIIDKKEDVLRIPIDSYYNEEGKFYVFINKNGKATPKEIEIGLIGEDYVEIKKGLKKNDKIIEVLENEISKGASIK